MVRRLRNRAMRGETVRRALRRSARTSRTRCRRFRRELREAEKEEEKVSCGKERFLTFAMADRVARLSRNRHDQVKLQPYRCKDCGGYHIGSSLGRRATKNGDLTVVEA